MPLATICFGVRAEHSSGSLGAALSAFDGLLTELTASHAGGAAIERQPFSMEIDELELWIQLDLLAEGESDAPARIAAAYLEFGLALAHGWRPDAAHACAEPLDDLLAACPSGRSVLTLKAFDVWLDLTFTRADASQAAEVCSVSLTADGILASDCRHRDQSVEIALRGTPTTLHCVPAAGASAELSNWIGERVIVSGSLDQTRRTAGQVWLTPVDRFALSHPWIVNPMQEQALTKFRAEWARSAAARSQATHGAV